MESDSGDYSTEDNTENDSEGDYSMEEIAESDLEDDSSMEEDTTENDSDVDDDYLMKFLRGSYPTRDEFFESCQPQTFSLPKSIMEYIWKNPKSPETYQRLAMSCKLAFLKNPILVIPTLNRRFDTDGYEYCPSSYWCDGCCDTHGKFDIKKLESKIWLEKAVYIRGINKEEMELLVSKTYQSDVSRFDISDGDISADNLSFFASKATEAFFSKSYVKNNDGTNVVFEKMYEVLTKIERWNFGFYGFYDISSIITANTVKEILKMPQFLNLKYLYMPDVSEKFNIEAFFTFMKENKMNSAEVILLFSNNISEAYKARLQAVVNDIVQTAKLVEERRETEDLQDEEAWDYWPPWISFNGMDEESREKLYWHHDRHY